jgi:hypothetical protein
MAAPKRLAEIWLMRELADGRTPQQAFAALNAATGRRYDYRRLWEWKTGKRPIPTPARRYMIGVALPYALKCVGLKLGPDSQQRLAEMLT